MKIKISPDQLETFSAVLREVLSSFTREEMEKLNSFEAFWDQVDIQNAYEEEWDSWKKSGIKAVYAAVYEVLTYEEKRI